MKCALYVLTGMIATPVVVALLAAVVVAPMVAADFLGFGPEWGALFWVLVFGAFIGARACHAAP